MRPRSRSRTARALFRLCLPALCAMVSAGAAMAAESGRPGRTLVVFAASSLTDALQEIGDDFGRSSGFAVKLSFAASSALARQIESGAPADVFFSADIAWMDYLAKRNLIQAASRRDLLGNQLVLIAPADSPVTLSIEPHFALLRALGGGRLATGDPDSVPVGRYARAALTSLGVWNDVQGHIARTENVRAALALVERREAPLGIVYKTDALVDKAVRIVGAFPANSHPPITYPVAVTTGARDGAVRFVDYLRGPAADAVFVKYGFVPPH